MSLKRECVDCDYVFDKNEPAWRTRCRDCYVLHKNSLKMRECEGCKQRFKMEQWKTLCSRCFKKSREKPVIKISRSKTESKTQSYNWNNRPQIISRDNFDDL